MVWLQYLLPQHLLSALMFRATRVRWPFWKNAQIRWFIRRYHVNMQEAASESAVAYADFNEFFTRALRPDARLFPAEAEAFASPVDGTVSQIGYLDGDSILQAKGRTYTLSALLGGDLTRADQFRNGAYATLYLSPRDYHRIHLPLDATLTEMLHLPGSLFAVNPATVQRVDGLFACNERVICYFNTACGAMAIVLVGAIFVGSIETVWAGRITPSRSRASRRWEYSDNRHNYRRGEELGRFNMGSTVIVITERGRVRWQTSLQPGSAIRMGQQLGTPVRH